VRQNTKKWQGDKTEKEGTSDTKNILVFPLNYAILFRSLNIGGLMNNSFRVKKRFHRKFSSIISSNCFNSNVKVIFDVRNEVNNISSDFSIHSE